MICADVLSALSEGRSPLVLTERIEHIEDLARGLFPQVPHLIVLQGGQSKKALDSARARISGMSESASASFSPPENLSAKALMMHGWILFFWPCRYRGAEPLLITWVACTVCTKANAPCAFMIMPISMCQCFPGCSIDAALDMNRWATPFCCPAVRCSDGRRKCPCPSIQNGRKITPQVFADSFATEWMSRWPTCSCMRRGIHPLQQKAKPAPEAPAKHSSTAGIQTLPELQNCFRLNSELPIPFDHAGHMEVDFLCEDLRFVVEVDGAQHLADADVYRRDRRKDALLQQHGYIVLRFLAEDVAKYLDHVLDAILAALVSRKNTRHKAGVTAI